MHHVGQKIWCTLSSQEVSNITKSMVGGVMLWEISMW
jgi:hypothetical protein